MKSLLNILLLVLFPWVLHAQQGYPDSLKLALKTAVTDSAKYSISNRLYSYYTNDNLDSAFSYINQCLLLARKNNCKLNEADCLQNIAMLLPGYGKYAESHEAFQEAFNIAENPASENIFWKFYDEYSALQNRLMVLGWTHLHFGINGGYTNNTDQQIFHVSKAIRLGEEVGNGFLTSLASMGLSDIYVWLNKSDSALTLLKIAEQIAERSGTAEKKYLGDIYLKQGYIYKSKGARDRQLHYYHKGLESLTVYGQNNITALSWAYQTLADYYLEEKHKDSSLYYAKKAVEALNSIGERNIGWSYLQLSKCYALRNETDSAYKYQGLALSGIDSSQRAEIKNQSEFLKQSYRDQMRVKDLEQEKASFQTRIRTNILLGGLFTISLIAFFLFRNNRQKQKANNQIAQQKEKVETTLQELKSTQAQLIQSEKMASLGELTAGIAHEIQNPLNFVNNFSEINAELAAEIDEAIEKGDLDDIRALASDIKSNQEKIREHGKRADSIVKGMLQHSRSSTGVKEPTDINKLADEYLRLAYHGMRAKDKSFNASIQTDFDPQLPLVPVVAQDIGRVLLNLFNNAFYAVYEKSKTAGPDYQPTVTISTQLLNKESANPASAGFRFAQSANAIIVRVADNGPGIPDAIKDKIFQPFFTTKPTGQGTGLGLSLSYDIVKAHGGSLDLMDSSSAGTVFHLVLPLSA